MCHALTVCHPLTVCRALLSQLFFSFPSAIALTLQSLRQPVLCYGQPTIVLLLQQPAVAMRSRFEPIRLVRGCQCENARHEWAEAMGYVQIYREFCPEASKGSCMQNELVGFFTT